MNLSEMDDSDAKRLVDFAAGLVFACAARSSGSPARCSCCHRPTSAVAAEDKARLAEGGFFNQADGPRAPLTRACDRGRSSS